MMMMRQLDHAVGFLLRGIAGVCFVALFVLLFVNVVARTFQLAGFSWFDEIVQGLFAWMVFIGAAALWREHEHFVVTWLEDSLGKTLAADLLRLVLFSLCLVFLVVMTIYGYDLFSRNNALTPILQFPVAVHYVAIPISGFVMTVYSLRDLVLVLTSIFTNKRNQVS